jgi:hypothetical protein
MLRAVNLFGYLVSILLVSACAEPPKEPPSPSAIDAIALETRVLHCELAAADRYDDGHSSISEVADNVIGSCYREIVTALKAFGLSLSDPGVEEDTIKMAVDHIEMARRNRSGNFSPSN